MNLLQRFNRSEVFIAPETVTIAEYPESIYHPEGGVCLVVGTAAGVREEIMQALALYPNADTCAVNEAGAIIPAKHIATCHPEKLEHFLDLAQSRWWPVDPDYMPTIHVKKQPGQDFSDIACEWEITIGAGSAMFAAAAMVRLGYDLVIMCGCPMTGEGGYAMPTHAGSPADPRIGTIGRDHQLVGIWHQQLNTMKALHPEICAKIRSTSGKTMETFGGIGNGN